MAVTSPGTGGGARQGRLFEVGDPARPRRGRLRRDRDSELGVRRTIRLPDHDIRSAHQMVQILEQGVYHLDDLVDAAVKLGLADQNNGRGRRKRGDTIHRHRVRSALDYRRRHGTGRPLGDCYWVIDGPPRRPANAVFVVLGHLSDITLALGAAAEMARRIEEPVDLILVDPPYQLGVGIGRDGRAGEDRYHRPRSVLIPGYVDVDPDRDYYEFTLEWVEPAAALLRPGGHLAVVTRPEQAAAVQMAAQRTGMLFTNSVVVPLVNGVAPTKHRYATSHVRLTIMTAPGGRGSQTFNLIPEMGTDQRGRPHPRDVWAPVLPYYARGRMRYSNQLPPPLADQAVRALSNEGDLVADFFAGSGTVPLICLLRDRRCFASDLNAAALGFTRARLTNVVQSRLACPPPLLEAGPGLFPELRHPGAVPA